MKDSAAAQDQGRVALASGQGKPRVEGRQSILREAAPQPDLLARDSRDVERMDVQVPLLVGACHDDLLAFHDEVHDLSPESGALVCEDLALIPGERPSGVELKGREANGLVEPVQPSCLEQKLPEGPGRHHVRLRPLIVRPPGEDPHAAEPTPDGGPRPVEGHRLEAQGRFGRRGRWPLDGRDDPRCPGVAQVEEEQLAIRDDQPCVPVHGHGPRRAGKPQRPQRAGPGRVPPIQ